MSIFDQGKERGLPEGGLRCTKCGCRRFRVLWTRPSPPNKIRRCRACQECGKRIWTDETKLGDL